ncbi:hypothetical protein BH23GEM9_BH23GEM9_28420 [soil metagenome]
MSIGERDSEVEAARQCVRDSVAGLSAEGVERRHEWLMEWAETEIGLERDYAEQVYALAEECELEPVYGFLLVRCNVGVRELEAPDQDADELASQQAPPEWLEGDTVELEDVAMERRLRTTFRRLRTHLSESSAAAAGIDAFLSEPDIGIVLLR